MTRKELVQTSLRHKQPPTVPYQIGFTKVAHEKMAAFYGNPDFERDLGNCLNGIGTAPAGAWTEVKTGFWRDQFGVIWAQTVDKDIGVPANVLVTPATVDSFRFPDPDDATRYAGADRAIQDHPDLYAVGNIGFSLYERAWTLAGMEGPEPRLTDRAPSFTPLPRTGRNPVHVFGFCRP